MYPLGCLTYVTSLFYGDHYSYHECSMSFLLTHENNVLYNNTPQKRMHYTTFNLSCIS